MPEISSKRANPTLPASRTTPGRRRTSSAVPAHYRNRPPEIRTAIYRVWELTDDLGLTRSMVAVLQAIIAVGIDRNSPYQPVFASKKKLASLAKASEASVYRALSKLSLDGLINRHEQSRLADKSFDLAYLSITSKLAAMLGLAQADAGGAGASEIEPTPENDLDLSGTVPNLAEMTALAEKELAADVTFVKGIKVTITVMDHENSGASPCVPPPMTDGLTDEMRDGPIEEVNGSDREANDSVGTHQSTGRQRFVRMAGRSVPEELVWLIEEKRLSFGQLFELMTKARKVAGQSLTGYVELRSDRIRQLPTIHDCYRYLSSLIDNELDATYLLANRQEKEHRQHRRTQRETAARERGGWLVANDGRKYVDKSTGFVWRINASNQIIEVRDADRFLPSLRVTGHVLKQLQSDRFTPYREAESARDCARGRIAALAAKYKPSGHVMSYGRA